MKIVERVRKSDANLLTLFGFVVVYNTGRFFVCLIKVD